MIVLPILTPLNGGRSGLSACCFEQTHDPDILGPVSSLRPRYRCSGVSTSLGPADESLGLVADYPTGPAAEIGPFMMGLCMPRDCVDIFERVGGMRPSVGMLQRLMVRVHETWGSIREPILSGLRAGEGIPAATRSVTVSLDGIMVPLQPRARSYLDAAWREASWWHGQVLRQRWQAIEDAARSTDITASDLTCAVGSTRVLLRFNSLLPAQVSQPARASRVGIPETSTVRSASARS